MAANNNNNNKIVVVTGGNKGIGYEIVKGLAGNATVVLTARNQQLGTEAVANLKKEGLNAVFHQLDVTNAESIANFTKWFSQSYPRLDILVNNAGILLDGPADSFNEKNAKSTLDVNYWGVVNVTRALLPYLHKGSRVVTVASQLGKLGTLTNEAFKANLIKIADGGDEKKIDELASNYPTAVANGTFAGAGYVPKDAGMMGFVAPQYITSKQLVIAFTKAFGQNHKDIVSTVMCPGYCATDINGNSGNRTAAKGAETVIYLATSELPAAQQQGSFYYDLEPIEW